MAAAALRQQPKQQSSGALGKGGVQELTRVEREDEGGRRVGGDGDRGGVGLRDADSPSETKVKFGVA